MEKPYLKSMTTSNNNTNSSPTPISPTPTTFVQADPNTFKDLVQKLTGSSGESEKFPVTLPARLASKQANIPVDPTGPRRSPFKLQDRRLRKLEIKLSLATIGSGSAPRQIKWLDSPAPSPVTPLGSESLFLPSSSSGSASPSPSPSPAASPAASEEEMAMAMAVKGFYLHPSPLSTPRASEPPELLNLFPLTSPSSSSSSHQKSHRG